MPIAGKALGSLAVALFFSISGFLICQSWERDPHIGRYAARRALRIFPGLWVVVLLTAFMVGPLFTTVSHSEYFLSGSPWQYLASASFAIGSPKLLGVFESNPFPLSTNGSLWTLKYEIIMYALLALTGYVLGRTRLKAKCTAIFLAFALAWVLMSLGGHVKVAVPFVWRLGTELYLDRLAYLGAFFFAGACAHFHFDRIHLSRRYALALLGLLFFIENPTVVMVVLWFAMPYFMLVFAYRAPAIFRKVNGFDYSYGIYIYAFPIQQIVSQLGMRAGWSWEAVLLVSTLVTLAAAALSWHLVEKPGLALKDRISLRRKTVEPDDPGLGVPGR